MDFLTITDTLGVTHLISVAQLAHVTAANGGSQINLTTGAVILHADPPATFAATAATQVVAGGGTWNHAVY